MSYTERIRITKGGKLVAEVWENRQKQDVDITNELYDHLFNVCHVDDDVVLKDLLLLVKDWCQVLSPITTSSPVWLKELVDEGLNKPFRREGDSVKHLELSWGSEVRQYKNEPKHLEEWVSFDGIGDPPEGDESYKNWPAGQPVNYALDFSPVDTLSELPVRLNRTIKIYDETNKKVSYPPPILIEAEKEFRLADILRGVFWELSFHGSPSSRDERSEELDQRMDEIEKGTAKLIPWEEVKERMDKLLKDDDEGTEPK